MSILEPRCMVCGAPLGKGAPFLASLRESEVCSDKCYAFYADTEAQNERTDIKWNPVMIVVEGHRYRLLGKLGYQHSAGVFAREVETEDGPRIVVRKANSVVWHFSIPNDCPEQKPEAEND